MKHVSRLDESSEVEYSHHVGQTNQAWPFRSHPSQARCQVPFGLDVSQVPFGSKPPGCSAARVSGQPIKPMERSRGPSWTSDFGDLCPPTGGYVPPGILSRTSAWQKWLGQVRRFPSNQTSRNPKGGSSPTKNGGIAQNRSPPKQQGHIQVSFECSNTPRQRGLLGHGGISKTRYTSRQTLQVISFIYQASMK